MTSISPDRNTVYDYDLSTLSNIRLNNRKSKQKLSNNVLNESNRPSLYNKNRLSKYNDDSTDLKFLNNDFSPSPVKKHSYFPSATASKRSYQFTPLKSKPTSTKKDVDYDIDESLLEKENLRYLDKDFYSQGSKLNQLKRDRFLNQIASPPPKEQFNNDFEDIYNIKPYNLSPQDNLKRKPYKDLGFRPRNKDIQIPNLRYDDDIYQSRWKSPIKSKTSKNNEFNIDDDILGNQLDHDKEELRKYDQHFERLVDKYGLSEQLSKPSPISRPSSRENLLSSRTPARYEDDNFNQKIVAMDYSLQEKLEHYKNMIKKFQHVKQLQSKENQELNSKLIEVEKFVEFLESNFDQLYKKLNILRLEKHNIHKTNQELVFINNFYKNQLKKQERKTPSLSSSKTRLTTKTYNSPSKDDTISLIEGDHAYREMDKGKTINHTDEFNDDSTTYNLLNFNPIQRSKTFHKLSSEKKFKALAFTVIATVRLQTRVKQHEAYIKKIKDLMI